MTTYELTGTDARRAAQLALIIKCKEYHPLAAADTDTEARRRALIALHVAGRARYGKAWDGKRAHWVEAATDGRTKSARECTTSELEEATRFINRGSFPVYMRPCAVPGLEDFTYLDGNPPVKWVAYSSDGGCFGDW